MQHFSSWNVLPVFDITDEIVGIRSTAAHYDNSDTTRLLIDAIDVSAAVFLLRPFVALSRRQ